MHLFSCVRDSFPDASAHLGLSLSLPPSFSFSLCLFLSLSLPPSLFLFLPLCITLCFHHLAPSPLLSMPGCLSFPHHASTINAPHCVCVCPLYLVPLLPSSQCLSFFWCYGAPPLPCLSAHIYVCALCAAQCVCMCLSLLSPGCVYIYQTPNPLGQEWMKSFQF